MSLETSLARETYQETDVWLSLLLMPRPIARSHTLFPQCPCAFPLRCIPSQLLIIFTAVYYKRTAHLFDRRHFFSSTSCCFSASSYFFLDCLFCIFFANSPSHTSTSNFAVPILCKLWWRALRRCSLPFCHHGRIDNISPSYYPLSEAKGENLARFMPCVSLSFSLSISPILSLHVVNTPALRGRLPLFPCPSNTVLRHPE